MKASKEFRHRINPTHTARGTREGFISKWIKVFKAAVYINCPSNLTDLNPFWKEFVNSPLTVCLCATLC